MADKLLIEHEGQYHSNITWSQYTHMCTLMCIYDSKCVMMTIGRGTAEAD